MHRSEDFSPSSDGHFPSRPHSSDKFDWHYQIVDGESSQRDRQPAVPRRSDDRRRRRDDDDWDWQDGHGRDVETRGRREDHGGSWRDRLFRSRSRPADRRDDARSRGREDRRDGGHRHGYEQEAYYRRVDRSKVQVLPGGAVIPTAGRRRRDVSPVSRRRSGTAFAARASAMPRRRTRSPVAALAWRIRKLGTSLGACFSPALTTPSSAACERVHDASPASTVVVAEPDGASPPAVLESHVQPAPARGFAPLLSAEEATSSPLRLLSRGHGWGPAPAAPTEDEGRGRSPPPAPRSASCKIMASPSGGDWLRRVQVCPVSAAISPAQSSPVTPVFQAGIAAPAPAHAPSSLSPLFVPLQPAILADPIAVAPRALKNRRKTLAGITGFNLGRCSPDSKRSSKPSPSRNWLSSSSTAGWGLLLMVSLSRRRPLAGTWSCSRANSLTSPWRLCEPFSSSIATLLLPLKML
ncbi:hypothetical protein VPH35_106789 [Triticum aestivum]